MGRHQEAYEAVAKCSLAVPQVRDIICKFSARLVKLSNTRLVLHKLWESDILFF